MERRTRFDRVLLIEDLDLLERKDPGVLYIDGRGKEPLFVAFICPCGCELPCTLPTRQTGAAHPVWQVVYKDGKITIDPSIRRQGACNAHFWIKENKVEWC